MKNGRGIRDTTELLKVFLFPRAGGRGDGQTQVLALGEAELGLGWSFFFFFVNIHSALDLAPLLVLVYISASSPPRGSEL